MPTLIRLERGDSGVSLGVVATALWLIGRAQALPDLAAPAEDRGALEADVREAVSRRAARARGSHAGETHSARNRSKPARR